MAVAAGFLAVWDPFSVALAETIRVPATANIFGAGRSAPPPGDGGVGTLPPEVALPVGKYRVATFPAISGEVTCCNAVSPATDNTYQGSRKRETALKRCLGRGDARSFGAVWMYEVVRKHGAQFFDADPARPGTQATGPRTNN